MKKWLLLLLLAAPLHAAERLYPEGKVFPIGGYSPRPEQDKAAGFTLAGPTYGDSGRLLRECEAVGLPMVYRIRTSFDVKGRKGEPQFDAALIREEVRQQVEAVAPSETIYAWTISPEELRHWRRHELAYFRLVVETIRQHDPRHRPVWMYEPGHRDATALAKLLPEMDASAKGMYTNYSERMDERGWVRWSLRQQREAIASANPRALFFALPEMFRQPPEGREGEIPRWVRHDLYTALAEGAQGVLIYSFAKRSGFTARDAYYQAYAEVAREWNGPLQIGPAFLLGKARDTAKWELTQGPDTISFTPSAKEEAVSFSSFLSRQVVWEGREYLLVVNSAPERLALRLTGSTEGWQAMGDAAREVAALTLDPWETLLFTRTAP